MAVAGNTIRLTVTFTDTDAVAVDPSSVIFRVYDAEYNQLGTDVIVTANRLGTGVYYHDYCVPVGIDSALYAEFAGTADGVTIVGRIRLDREFSDD
jgi:hypothetical protein